MDATVSTGSGSSRVKAAGKACLKSLAWWRVSLVTTAALTLFDQASDVAVSLTFLNAGHAVWGTIGLTLFGVGLIPSWGLAYIVLVEGDTAKSSPLPAKVLRAVLGLFGLGPLTAVYDYWTIDTEEEDSDSRFFVSMAKIAESAVESFGQTLLQSYVLFVSTTAEVDTDAGAGEDATVAFTSAQARLQTVSLAVSVASLSFAMAKWRLMFDGMPDGGNWLYQDSVLSEVTWWVMSTLEVCLKVGALCVFGASYRGWLFVLVGLELAVKFGVLVWAPIHFSISLDRARFGYAGLQAVPGMLISTSTRTGRECAAAFLFNGALQLLMLLLPIIPGARPAEGGMLGAVPVVHGVCDSEGATGCIPSWPFVTLGVMWACTYLVGAPLAMSVGVKADRWATTK